MVRYSGKLAKSFAVSIHFAFASNSIWHSMWQDVSNFHSRSLLPRGNISNSKNSFTINQASKESLPRADQTGQTLFKQSSSSCSFNRINLSLKTSILIDCFFKSLRIYVVLQFFYNFNNIEKKHKSENEKAQLCYLLQFHSSLIIRFISSMFCFA